MTVVNVTILLGFLCLIPVIHGIAYEIAVFTGDVFGAGTDAKVFVTLYGGNTKSPEKELDTKNSNDFERNHVDTYKIDTPDVGPLKKIKIRHDNSWFGSGWFLEKVLIKDKKGCVYNFPCHNWLASNWGDKKVARVLVTRSTCKGGAKKNTVCHKSHSLGVSSGLVKDKQITASSSYDDKHQASHARLNKIAKGSRGAWCSAFADDTEYLQVDFNDITSIGGIATQGQAMFNNWVTKYSLSYSTNGSTWEDLKENGKTKTFTGNKDRESVVSHNFKEIKAKAIRIHPLAWEGLTNCMRVELYGCEKVDPSVLSNRKRKEKQVEKAKETQEIPTDAKIMTKAVLYLKFETITGMDTIPDQSDLHNDARIVNFARLSRYSEKCGRGVDLNGGDVILSGEYFVNKPHKAVTIATWIKLFNMDGYNSVFDTIGGINSTHTMGQYHFEVNNGSVRWFHRNEKGAVIFNVITEVIVPPQIWTHIACTYDASSGYAQVFVNAKFVMREEGVGLLSQDWQVRAGIGEHKGERQLDAYVDEFYISDKALSQEEIKKLMKRCEFEKECFSPIGMEDLKITDEQITASSILQPHKPYYARLNLISFYDDTKKSAWCSDDDDKDPYLTIDLKTEKTISGVAVQGASVFDSFVTSYKLCYSHSGRKYDCVKENSTQEALIGSEDKDNIKIHWLNKFFDARFIRFYPLSWYGSNICMRVELYGCMTGLLSDTIDEPLDKEIDPDQTKTPVCSSSCGKGVLKKVKQCNSEHRNNTCSPGQKTFEERTECIQPSCPECFSPMRVSNGTQDITVYVPPFSSKQVHPDTKAKIRDNIAMAETWCADTLDKKQFLEVDLWKPIKVSGIGTQGEVTADRWVSSYRVSYSIKGLVWNNYTEAYRLKIFTGNDDKDTMSIRHLKHPVTARYVRLHPLTWHGGSICMRAEIFGCDHSSNAFRHTKVTTEINDAQANPKHQVMKEDATAQVVNSNAQYRQISTSSNFNQVPARTKVTSRRPKAQKDTTINSSKHSLMGGVPMMVKGQAGLRLAVKPNSPPKRGSSRFPIVVNAGNTYLANQNIKIIPLTKKVQTQPVPVTAAGAYHSPNGINRYPYIKQTVASPYVHKPGKTGYLLPKPLYRKPSGATRMFTNQRMASERFLNRVLPNQQRFHTFGAPLHLVPNGFGLENFGLTAGSLLEGNSRKYKPQKTPGPLYNKFASTVQKMPAPALTKTRMAPLQRTFQNQRTGYLSSNAKTVKAIPNAAANRYRINAKQIPMPQYSKLTHNPNLNSVTLAKAPNYNIYKQAKPQGPSNIVSLHLKEKFKDSTSHHFLEERLFKEKNKEEMATKMDTVNPSINKYSWSAFGACSVTCGRGVKEKYRKCNAMECIAEGSEMQIIPCFNPPCKASTQWSAYSSCSATCGSGLRTRTRTCDGKDCPITGKEIATILCRNPDCPVMNFDFEAVDGRVVIDKSGKGNNAFMKAETRIIPYKGICGHHVDLGYRGNLLLEDLTFRQKPKYGISIACWINLEGTSRGSHSLFSTSKALDYGQILGGYHFEVDDGRVRWFHRSHLQRAVFSVITNDIIEPNTWYHVVGTYSSNDGKAKVYIDGKLEASSPGSGLLDDDWGYKASVGTFDFDGRYIRGKMDDIYMYDYEISPQQIHGLLSIKCPHKKT